MNIKLTILTLVAALSMGCAGLHSAIPTVDFDLSDEAIDVQVHSRVDRSLLCVPAKLGEIPVLGKVLEETVGICAEDADPVEE